MPIGPGKYDDLCTLVRTKLQARGALLIVIDGTHGSGFSCQADAVTTVQLPEILERVARENRASLEQGRL
jgi:hypothetical protein